MQAENRKFIKLLAPIPVMKAIAVPKIKRRVKEKNKEKEMVSFMVTSYGNSFSYIYLYRGNIYLSGGMI